MLAAALAAAGAVAAPAPAANTAPVPAAKGPAAAAAAKPLAATLGMPKVVDPDFNPGKQRVKSYASPAAPELQLLAAKKALTAVAASDKALVSVPDSFLGLSLDLNDIEGVAHPDFIGFVRHLTDHDTGPMLMRVGAYSADRLVKPWPATVYKALTALNNATGMQFIIGVNQHAEDPDLTKEQIQRSEKLLPPGSVVSFAVGNEPDMYSLPPKKGLPGSFMPKPVTWLSEKWIPVAQALYKAAGGVTSRPRMLAGPDWSDPNIDPKKLQWWLNSVKPYVNMVSVHLYGGDVINDKKIDTILADKRMLQKLSNVPNVVKVAKANSLPLRISEAATISYGGVQGISDTAGGALWALDVSMEAAHMGAEGIHFHQVLTRENNANYNAIYYNALLNRVRARQPLWGYIMLQQALSGGADITARAITGECKVWLLKGRKTGELRALIVNKLDKSECAADIKLTPDQAKRYADTGMAHYMFATFGLSDRWRIYYSGAYFDEWGSAKQQDEQLVPVRRYALPGGAAGFAVHLTNGTIAALVTIPLASKAPPKALPVAAPAAAAAAAAGGAPGVVLESGAAPKGTAAKAPAAAAAKPAAAKAAKPLPVAKPAAPKPAARRRLW